MASAFTASLRLGLQYGTPAMACGLVAVTSSGSSPTSNTSFTTSCEGPAKTKFQSLQQPPDVAASFKRRMTSVGRFSLLSETKSNPSIPVLLMCLSGKEWTAKDFVNLYESRGVAEKHERFRATLESNDSSHFTVHDSLTPRVRDVLGYPQIYRTEIKDWISDAIKKPIDLTESLWQAEVVTGGALGQSGAISRAQADDAAANGRPGDVESLLLFRAHHCMADGVSLGTIFGDLMDEGEEFRAKIDAKITEYKKRKKSWWQRLKDLVFYWWLGSIRAILYQMYVGLVGYFSPNPWARLKAAADDSETESRNLSWVQVASVDEVKEVAQYFSQFSKGKVTINDIFCSCIGGAIAKLMDHHRRYNPDLNLRLPYMTLAIPVHLQGGVILPGQSIGNKIGAMTGRVPAEAVSDPKDRLLQVHDTIATVKRTPMAVVAYLMARFGGNFGHRLGSWTPWMFERLHGNTTVAVTNVIGADTVSHLEGRRVEATLGFLPLPPGIPMGMVVQSYAGKMTLTVMAEPWAVPDADLFMSWVAEEYKELRKQALEGKRLQADSAAVE